MKDCILARDKNVREQSPGLGSPDVCSFKYRTGLLQFVGFRSQS